MLRSNFHISAAPLRSSSQLSDKLFVSSTAPPASPRSSPQGLSASPTDPPHPLDCVLDHVSPPPLQLYPISTHSHNSAAALDRKHILRPCACPRRCRTSRVYASMRGRVSREAPARLQLLLIGLSFIPAYCRAFSRVCDALEHERLLPAVACSARGQDVLRCWCRQTDSQCMSYYRCCLYVGGLTIIRLYVRRLTMSSSYVYASLSLISLCALAGAGVGVGSGVAMMYSQVGSQQAILNSQSQFILQSQQAPAHLSPSAKLPAQALYMPLIQNIQINLS